MERYYIHNLETDKLNIFTGGKSDWLTIPEADQDRIKSACLWSRSINGWVSRNKGGRSRFYADDVLQRNGFEFRGTEGERLSFADQVAEKMDRAENRAERFEDRAVKNQDEAKTLYDRAHGMADCIPLGQPILIGHYSEGRDRRFRERISKTFERAFEANDTAKYYAQRAAVARSSASGAQFSDPAYLGNRIKEMKAEIAVLENRLQGKFYHYSQPTVTESLDQAHEKLDFFEHCLATCGRAVFNKETLAGKQLVKVRGRWEPIVKLNKTTVATPNICFPLAEDQRRYALKYAYTEVQDAK